MGSGDRLRVGVRGRVWARVRARVKVRVRAREAKSSPNEHGPG